MKNHIHTLTILSFLFVSPIYAGEADVTDVQISKSKNETYNVKVSVSHADTGWDHYANKWEILDEKESIIATRVLHHPHENEQPFTRSLSGVAIPAHIKWIKVRAHDSVHGYGGKTIKVDLQ